MLPNGVRRFLAAILLCGCGTLAPLRAETLAIGSPAPDFRLPGVDGKSYGLHDFDPAEILVIVFTCNHCPTAQAYEERIQRLARDYRARKVAVVAISPNDPQALRLDELGYTDVGDSFEDMKLRAQEQGFAFPYLYDGKDQQMSRAYGPVATPHVFIFDRARKLRFVGRIDNSDKPDRVTTHDTRDAIEALLSGKPVPVEKTKTFGCSVKWSQKQESVEKARAKWAQEPVELATLDAAGIRALAGNAAGPKLRLINVWATWCGPCVAELSEFAAIQRMYRRRDFELVTITADAPAEKDKALAVLKEHQVSAQNYLFAGNDKYKLMEAVDPAAEGNLPHTLLVAPGGKVLYRKSGACEPLAIKRAIVNCLGRTYK